MQPSFSTVQSTKLVYFLDTHTNVLDLSIAEIYHNGGCPELFYHNGECPELTLCESARYTLNHVRNSFSNFQVLRIVAIILVGSMAHRAISSDSEDEHDTPILRNRPIRSNRLADTDDEDEELTNPDINSFASSIHSEESNLSEPANPDIDSFTSSIYSEPESNLSESFGPLQVARKRTSKQTIIVSDDEEVIDISNESTESPGNIDKAEIEDDKILLEDNSLHSNVTERSADIPGRVITKVNTTEESEVEEREEQINAKENNIPSSSSLLPAMPLTVPVLDASRTNPISQLPPAIVDKVPPQTVTTAKQQQASTYYLAHTRPALLKQLEHVKVSNINKQLLF